MKNFDTTWKQIEEHLLTKQTDLNLNDIVLIGLDRSAEAMMSGAYRLNNGVFRSLSWTTSCGGELADEATVLADDDTILVKFYETRRSAKDNLPNGIRCDEAEEVFTPVVVFLNTGDEDITVNGTKLASSDWTPIWKAVERGLYDADVQKAMAEFCEKAKGDILELQLEHAEKKNAEKTATTKHN